MVEPTLGLRERNRIRTRDEILVAVSVLLGERTFEAISVDDIAQRARVSRGTIYSYFPEGREQLVRDAYQRVAQATISAGIAQHDHEPSTVGRIIAFAQALVATVCTPEGRFYGVMGPDIMGPLSSVVGTSSRTFHQILLSDLEQASLAGLIADTVSVSGLAVIISGAVREIGVIAANEPARAPALIQALRAVCSAVIQEI